MVHANGLTVGVQINWNHRWDVVKVSFTFEWWNMSIWVCEFFPPWKWWMKNKHRSKRRVCFLFAASSGVAARSHFLVLCASATQFRSDVCLFFLFCFGVCFFLIFQCLPPGWRFSIRPGCLRLTGIDYYGATELPKGKPALDNSRHLVETQPHPMTAQPEI